MSNTWIELDLGILGANLRALNQCVSPETEIIFVVKSNAYGHGMIPVARHAWKCGVKWFAVAHVEEALALRAVLPRAEIIIVGAIDPAQTVTAIKHNLVPVIVDDKHAKSLAAAAARVKSNLRCHAKIDTGMGRLGFAWEDAGKILPVLARRKGLDICGICSHFASANPADRRFADVQANRFQTVVATCEKAGMKKLLKHISNSGGIICNPAWHHDGVRPGILLYGYGKLCSVLALHSLGEAGFGVQCSDARGQKSSSFAKATEDKEVRDQSNEEQGSFGIRRSALGTSPLLSWKTRILQIKKVPARFPVSYDCTYVTKEATHIATIDVGYADGYHRALSNKGIVIAGGKRRRVVGRVTMNLVMIDIGAATKVRERDEVVLIGSQGKESIWADELATLAGTIPYEILTSVRTDETRISTVK